MTTDVVVIKLSGTFQKGSVTWDAERHAWKVVHAYRVGMRDTARATDWFVWYPIAVGQYREHARDITRDRATLTT